MSVDDGLPGSPVEAFYERADARLEAVIHLDTGRIHLREAPFRLPQRFVTYAVRTMVPFPRYRGGESRVLYVGEGDDSRADQLLSGKHSAVRSFYRLGMAAPSREVRVKLHLWGRSSKWQARMLEAVLLGHEIEKHGEMPPANARWEGWWQEHVLRAMVAQTLGESSLEATNLYEFPSADPFATILDSYTRPLVAQDGRTWRQTLVWVWPRAYCSRDPEGSPQITPNTCVIAG